MRRQLILTVAMASISAAALSADTQTFSGKWTIHISVSGSESDSFCTFSQKDNILSGTCKSDNGEGKISGKVDGTKITWSYESEYNGSPLTSKYSGSIDPAAKKITGTVFVEQFGVDGSFTGAPSN